MSIASRKERQKEELREKILTAAKGLFIELGYEHTSIRNIAERIEYSPTTIYLYFKDKDDIFHALHSEGFRLLNQYFRALAHVSDPFERLKAISRAYVKFASENREFYDLMFIHAAPMNAVEEKDCLWEEGDRAFGFLVQTIEQCQENGLFKGINAEIMAFTAWSAVHGICSLLIRDRCQVISELNRPNLVDNAVSTVITMLERMNEVK